MIKLRKFEETDIPRFAGWIPDARFLLQWAGHHYRHPLDRAQLLKSIDRTRGDRPAHFMFTASLRTDGTAVGHVELMNVDYENGIARLGRVLIGQPIHRGCGMGSALVGEALNYGFHKLGLTELNLSVPDLNRPAVRCFEKCGFAEYEFRERALQFENESWNLVMMRMGRHEFMDEINNRQES